MTSFSLRAKVHGILILSVTVLAILTEVAFIFYLDHEMQDDEKDFLAHTAQNASILADTIAAPVIDKDFTVLNNLASRYQKYPFCEYVIIADADQRIMARSGRLDLGEKFSTPVPFESYRMGGISVSKYLNSGKEYLNLSCPIKAGDLVLGAVQLGFTAEFRADGLASLKKSILVSGLATIGVIVLGFFLASWVVDKTILPLLNLKKAADRIRSGDYDQFVLMQSKDEVGLLIQSFNDMARELKNSRAGLVEKQYLDSVISNMQESLFVLTPGGLIQTVNTVALEMTGYEQTELLNGPFEALFKEPEEGRALLSQVRGNQRIAHSEEMIRSKSGKMIPVLVSGSILAHGSDPIGMVFVATNITEQRKNREELQIHRELLQQLVDERTAQLTEANQKLKEQIAERERMEEELVKAQKLESVALLAGGIAHDFNNMLTTILSNISLSMLEIGRGHNAANDSLKRAEQATLRAANLTQQLLTFSKGGAPIKRISSIGAIVRESSEFALQGSPIVCDISIPEYLWLAEVDAGQISQVIHNLVLNSVQAMPGGGTIEICCENVLHAGSGATASSKFVKVVVRDKGLGIAREHLSKIFDPYFTTKQRGSGLGLATAYSIIKKHGGDISVESELGSGTTFTLFIPSSDARGEVLPDRDKQLQVGQGKILLMDDDAELRQVCRDALTKLGYATVPASDGMQAVELFKEAMKSGTPFNAVILDLTIKGGMGGKETIKHLLEMKPDLKAVVSSGYSNDPVMSDYRSHGFHAVLVKPYRIENLSETIYSLLMRNETSAYGGQT